MVVPTSALTMAAAAAATTGETDTAVARGAAGMATVEATEDRAAVAAMTARQPVVVATQIAADTMMHPRHVADRRMGAAMTIAAAMVAGAPSSCTCYDLFIE